MQSNPAPSDRKRKAANHLVVENKDENDESPSAKDGVGADRDRAALARRLVRSITSDGDGDVDGGLSVVPSPGGGGCEIRAARALSAGEVIGPVDGVSTSSVLDPVEVLARHPVARAALEVGGASAELAFWMALASMAAEVEGRDNAGAAEGLPSRREGGDGDGAPGGDAAFGGRFDAYLSSLPREGPDPCCWSAAERSDLLGGTPLADQVGVTLGRLKEEYARVAAAMQQHRGGEVGATTTAEEPPTRGVISAPPFCVDGRGAFPSVLWARGVHQSRSFPRALLDEEGVWWVGRKKLIRPLDRREGTEAADRGGAVLCVRLGGWRAPKITYSVPENDAPPTVCGDDAAGNDTPYSSPPSSVAADASIDSVPEGDTPPTARGDGAAGNENPRPSSPSPFKPDALKGSALGIMLPLFDMLDHKPGHPVQWEAGNGRIRFRCVEPVERGGPIWNNYGPKGNGELLSTYGFAAPDNPLDSVEGIVLGCKCTPWKEGGGEGGGGEVHVHEARMALVREHSLPHRIEKGLLLLGPFSLHRELPGKGVEDNEFGDGVIPTDLFRALSLFGMESAEEGPVISPDEIDILKDVLTKRLDSFRLSDVSRNAEYSRAGSVAAYKDGQRRLLRLALAELDAVIQEEEGEEEENLDA